MYKYFIIVFCINVIIAIYYNIKFVNIILIILFFIIRLLCKETVSTYYYFRIAKTKNVIASTRDVS